MLTLLFVIFLLCDVCLRFWLGVRQIRHVHRHHGQVPPEFAGRISLHSHQRAARYTIARTRLGLIERLVEACLLLALTLLGGLQWLDIAIARLIDHELLRQLVLIGTVLAIMGAAGLPFAWYRKFVLEARFGFNRMTPGLFVADTVKALLLVLLLGTPLCAALLGLMAWAGSDWPWYGWGLWVAFNLLVLWLYPRVIAPLFNTFKPLEDAELRERIAALAQRCQFQADGLYVMDGSRRSAHGNAYFTGLGRSKRIVFFDTLLNKLQASEIEAVLAHELGHFKHRHIQRRLLISLLSSLGFFLLAGWAWSSMNFYTSLGVIPQLGRPNDALALILFFLVLPTFTFWMSPLAAYVSRRDEYQADRFAASHSQADDLISALLKLYNDNAATLTPDPIHSAFYDSHPNAIDRIQHLKSLA
ncbi:M48 family metallopeptidase [Alcaligenes sp. SDU_A2]|uniref:M48 family metallopeptidase n=1 Tax=Alcaligenes sp. SDU_A2 TaxID=3136634 RepID=UPI00311D63E5